MICSREELQGGAVTHAGRVAVATVLGTLPELELFYLDVMIVLVGADDPILKRAIALENERRSLLES